MDHLARKEFSFFQTLYGIFLVAVRLFNEYTVYTQTVFYN